MFLKQTFACSAKCRLYCREMMDSMSPMSDFRIAFRREKNTARGFKPVWRIWRATPPFALEPGSDQLPTHFKLLIGMAFEWARTIADARIIEATPPTVDAKGWARDRRLAAAMRKEPPTDKPIGPTNWLLSQDKLTNRKATATFMIDSECKRSNAPLKKVESF